MADLHLLHLYAMPRGGWLLFVMDRPLLNLATPTRFLVSLADWINMITRRRGTRQMGLT